jgi:hypothetical protein
MSPLSFRRAGADYRGELLQVAQKKPIGGGCKYGTLQSTSPCAGLPVAIPHPPPASMDGPPRFGRNARPALYSAFWCGGGYRSSHARTGSGATPRCAWPGHEVRAALIVVEGVRALGPPHPHLVQDLGSIDAGLAGNGGRELSTRLQDYVDCNVPN